MASEENIKKIEAAVEHRCPTCHSSISYDPKLDKWKCKYCYNSFTIDEINKYNDKKKNVEEYNGYVSYKCESCGAEIIVDENTSATFCVYCGNTAILKSKLTGKFNPTSLIPFKTEKEDAIKAFKALSKGRPLIPNEFLDEKNIEKIRGVYVPFWLYDVNVAGDVEMLGKRVKKYTDGYQSVTLVDRYEITRGGTMRFNSIPIDGSSRFDNDIMNSIEPYNYNELVPYNQAYLSGFYAEKYDLEGEVLFNEVAVRALNSAEDYFVATARTYKDVTVVENKLKAEELHKEYVLLPVWMLNIKYKNKLYKFSMNGQTGECVGNIPVDKGKVIKFLIIIFAILFIVSMIFWYIDMINFGPGVHYR